ncbi:MAG: hypothetical protein Q9195_003163, partial [Heterodermia aff. obscurata]
MKISLTITAFCVGVASAVPLDSIHKPILSSSQQQYTTPELLNLILSLEHFQDAFYRQGLANFTQDQFAASGFPASFYSNLTDLASQEHTHVTSLTTTLQHLNITPVAECTYFFNATTPAVFVSTATLIEAVSVSSYISLLAKLRDAAYTQVYASVLAVEARHSAFVRAALGLAPFPSPYDTPIDLDETFTLAQLFTVSCPQENPLALTKFPTLSSSYSNHGAVGRVVTFVTYGKDIKIGEDCEPLYAAFLTLTGPVFAP